MDFSRHKGAGHWNRDQRIVSGISAGTKGAQVILFDANEKLKCADVKQN